MDFCPGAARMTMRTTGERRDGKLGAQIVGHHDGQMAECVDTFATAIHHRMQVEEISYVDPRTRPFSFPWDPVPMSAQD